MASSSFLETSHVVHCAPSGIIAANEDIFNGDPTTDIISMKNAGSCVFVIVKNAGAVGTATITIESCDDTSASTATAIAYTYRAITTTDTQGAVTAATSAGFTTATTANMIYVIEVNARDLVDGDSYVRMVCTEVANAEVDGAIFSFLTDLRYQEDALATQLT